MTQHLHATVVPGCYRCELSADEVPPLTLTDFLLTRIEEDEEWLKGEGYVLEDCQECAFGQQPRSPYSMARVLAECEAKERIVNMWRLAPPAADAWLTPVLLLLARVYADHPDYREEWKP